jgi:hypothetical protein
MKQRRRKRSVPRTPWHVWFAALLIERGSPNFDVQTEVELLRRPPRADFVLLRRKSSRPDRARVLRRLWRWIEELALVEFKSDAEPLRAGDLSWWLGLVELLCAIHQPARLQAVLVIVRRTPTLLSEVKYRGFALQEEGAGYLRLEGAGLDAKVVVLDEVAAAEREPLLGLFSGATLDHPSVRRWVLQHTGKVIEVMGAKAAQAFPDVLKAFLASLPAKRLLAGLTPEQRLAGLAPEQRLAGLAPEQRLAGLAPDEIADLLSALPAAARRQVAARLSARESTPRRKSSRRAQTKRATRR